MSDKHPKSERSPFKDGTYIKVMLKKRPHLMKLTFAQNNEVANSCESLSTSTTIISPLSPTPPLKYWEVLNFPLVPSVSFTYSLTFATL